MERGIRKFDFVVWSGVILLAGTLLLGLWLGLLKMRLAAPPLPVLGQVGEFSLTNQHGQPVSLASLKGKPWIADIIFTRCAGPCLKMTSQMRALQARGAPLLISLTTDPDYDTPDVLNQYAQRFGADPARWQFLTGAKDQIARLATESLKLTAIEKAPAERQDPADLFIHSTILVLVDKQGRLRAVFDTTGEGAEPAQAQAWIMSAVKRLERER